MLTTLTLTLAEQTPQFVRATLSGAGQDEVLEKTVSVDTFDSLRKCCEKTLLTQSHLFPSVEQLSDFGAQIADQVLSEEMRSKIVESIQDSLRNRDTILFRIDARADQARRIPWEILYFDTPELQTRFIARHPCIRLVRYIHTGFDLGFESQPEISLLVAHANPDSSRFPFLQWVDSERRDICSSTHNDPRFVYHEIRDAVPANLERALFKQRPHIMHFVGHGELRVTGGVLILQGERSGNDSTIYASTLAPWLVEAGTQLVVLSACNTAGHGASIAESLVEAGVPSVIGMQHDVLDGAVRGLSNKLYNQLPSGEYIDDVVASFRQLESVSSGWWIPVHIMSGDRQRLFPPPPESLHETKTSIPKFDIPFVGRKRERQIVGAQLIDRDCRLVNIFGAGGMGKTRLACQVAQDLRNYFDHVCFVECGSLSNESQLVAAISRAFEILPGPGEPLQRLVQHAPQGKILIVLDSIETLSMSSGTSAMLGLLEGIESAKFLTTSHARLNLEQERALQLNTLTYEEEPSLPSDSVDLFLAAKSPQSQAEDRELIGEICKALEGFPLTIVLAAGLLKEMTLKELHKRSVRIVSNSRELRDVIAKMMSLVPLPDLELLSRLCVFKGFFGFDDVIQVLDLSEEKVYDALPELRARGLLQRSEFGKDTQFNILDCIREYVESREYSSKETHFKDQLSFASYYARLTGQLSKEAQESRNRGATQTLWNILPNIRSAVEISIRNALNDQVVTFVKALSLFYLEAGLWPEFDILATAGHKAAKETSNADASILLFGIEGALAARRGDKTGCMLKWRKRLRLSESAGNKIKFADTLIDIGCHLYPRPSAKKFLTQAMPIATETGQLDLMGTVQVVLGHMAYEAGNKQEALKWAAEAESLVDAAKDTDPLMFVVTSLGKLFIKCEEPKRAERQLLKSLRIAASADRKFHMIDAALRLGMIYKSQEEFERAARYLVFAFKQDKALISKWHNEVIAEFDELRSQPDCPSLQMMIKELLVLPLAKQIELLLET